MPDGKRHNPFEDFISSDSFDVSKLDQPIATSFDGLDEQMQVFFESLPQPLTYELWDTELDDQQKNICAYLVTELIDRVLRENHAEELQDVSDEDLIHLLTVPVTLALLAQQRLHTPPEGIFEPPQREQGEIEPRPTTNDESPVSPQLLANWGDLFRTLKHKLNLFFNRFFRQ
jgi:hypothetical protein